jgi:hypothetical protein
MQVQSVSNQNFKGLQCHPNYGEVQYILATKLDGYGFDKAVKYLDKLSKFRAHSDVYLVGDVDKPRIHAQVENKLFKESFFFGPITTLKKAFKAARNFDQKADEEVAAKIMEK